MGRLIYDDRERVARWVAQGDDPLARYGSYYAMGMERDGELVAGIVMDHLAGSNAYVHITITKPGKDLYDLLRAFFDYAFRQCGLKRLSGMCPAQWHKVLAFDMHVGFEVEHRIREGYYGDDMVLLVMWRDKCRWINGSVNEDL